MTKAACPQQRLHDTPGFFVREREKWTLFFLPTALCFPLRQKLGCNSGLAELKCTHLISYKWAINCLRLLCNTVMPQFHQSCGGVYANRSFAAHQPGAF